MDKTNWIVGICCSCVDGVSICRRNGRTVNQMKELLVEEVKKAICNDPVFFDSGTDAICGVEEKETDGIFSLYAYASFGDYHMEFEAVVDSDDLLLREESYLLEEM